MTGALRDARAILASLYAAGPGRLIVAFALLLVGALTEGLSVLLLLPILALVSTPGAGVPMIDLAGRDLAGVQLPALVLPLWGLLLVLLGLLAVQALINRSRAVRLSDLLHRQTNGVRQGLFTTLAEARWQHLVRLRTADLEHALTGEVERIQSATMLLLTMIQGAVSLVLYVTLGLLISVPMTLFSAGFGLAALALLAPYRSLAARYGQQIQDNRKRQYRAVSGFLSGLKTAKAMNREEAEIAGFAALLETAQTEARDFSHRAATGAGLFQLALAVGAALFIHVALTHAGLGVTQIVVLLLVLMRLAPRFMGLQAQMQQFLVDLPAWRHVTALRTELADQRDTAHGPARAMPPLIRDIRLDHVTFRHADDLPPVLEDCCLTLRAGQVTALIGPSGSGKTTVADLVCGLIQPVRGRLLIDGAALDPAALRSWRSRIAYVTQDTWLPPGTIREALLAAATGATEDQMHAALTRAAADFVQGLPQGLDTLAGDRGMLLSGGERQRIALARALLRQPDLLILDEATSALDWQSQQRIARSLMQDRGGMTVLTIAHRPSMVEFADMVYALDHGHVVDAGEPARLRGQMDGPFARMLQHETAAQP